MRYILISYWSWYEAIHNRSNLRKGVDPNATLSSRCRFETDRDFVVTKNTGNYLKRCHVSQWFFFLFSGCLESLNPAFNEKKKSQKCHVRSSWRKDEHVSAAGASPRSFAWRSRNPRPQQGTPRPKAHHRESRCVSTPVRQPLTCMWRNALGLVETEILRERERVVCVARCVMNPFGGGYARRGRWAPCCCCIAFAR